MEAQEFAIVYNPYCCTFFVSFDRESVARFSCVWNWRVLVVYAHPRVNGSTILRELHIRYVVLDAEVVRSDAASMPGGSFVPGVSIYPGFVFLLCDLANVVVGVLFLVGREEAEIVYVHAYIIFYDCFAGFDLVSFFIKFAVGENVPCP